METVSIRYKQTGIYSVFENAELMTGEMQESGFAKWLGTITVALSAPQLRAWLVERRASIPCPGRIVRFVPVSDGRLKSGSLVERNTL